MRKKLCLFAYTILILSLSAMEKEQEQSKKIIEDCFYVYQNHLTGMISLLRKHVQKNDDSRHNQKIINFIENFQNAYDDSQKNMKLRTNPRTLTKKIYRAQQLSRTALKALESYSLLQENSEILIQLFGKLDIAYTRITPEEKLDNPNPLFLFVRLNIKRDSNLEN